MSDVRARYRAQSRAAWTILEVVGGDAPSAGQPSVTNGHPPFRGGVAYEAYRRSQGGKEAAVIDGLTGDQRFFLSYGQTWRTKYRDEELRALVLSNPHAPPAMRVNGAVRNVDAWYTAFNVQPGDRLYLAPEQRVRIWQ